MKTICFYFQVHQPFRLRNYRFFDMGKRHDYFDDYKNRSVMRKVAEKCYLPANNLMLSLIKEYGCKFKISFSISGTALDQFELYAPDVLDSFRMLAQTGCVEFLAETYSHSLSSLICEEEFFRQVKQHTQRVEELIGYKPKTFRNTELIYSDQIGAMVASMGYSTMLTEGAKHILGWKVQTMCMRIILILD
jgi:alpha-amylase